MVKETCQSLLHNFCIGQPKIKILPVDEEKLNTYHLDHIITNKLQSFLLNRSLLRLGQYFFFLKENVSHTIVVPEVL